jgi:hypothetical protein
MGVEAMPMGLKIPGNENIELPSRLAAWSQSSNQLGSAE